MEKHLIWDWNGTLLDDVSAAVAALGRMLAKRGAKKITVEEYRANFGFPVRPFYEKLGIDLSRWDWDGICEDFHRFIQEEPQSLRDGAKDAVRLASECGFRQSVLSALRQDLLESAIEEDGLAGNFERVFGTDNLDGASKLDRGRDMMRELGADPAHTVFVGDTLHDAEVAAAFGAKCILVSCGHQTAERLAAAGVPVAAGLQEAVECARDMIAGMPHGE